MRRAPDRRHLRRRVGEQVGIADTLVGKLVDEARIGAILEQAAHQIGEQVAMPADGRIGPALVAVLAHQPFEQALAHAVQPLEFEVALASCPFEDGRDGQRVMAGEGRIDVGGRQHVVRAGEVGDVGRRLAGEQRVAREPRLLRALDLAVPIGTLDETHRHPPPGIGPQRIGPGNHGAGALAIALGGHAETVPALEAGQAGDGLDDVEAHRQPFALLGVDGEADTGVGGGLRQLPDHVDKSGHGSAGVGGLIARVQRRQLDRDRVPVLDAVGLGGFPRVADGGHVAGEIAFAVGIGPRRLAEHVEAGGEAAIVLVAGAGQRLVDGAAHDEDLTHHPHRRTNALPHERLAGARDEAAQHAGLLVVGHQRAGHHQPPGGGIDQQ